VRSEAKHHPEPVEGSKDEGRRWFVFPQPFETLSFDKLRKAPQDEGKEQRGNIEFSPK